VQQRGETKNRFAEQTRFEIRGKLLRKVWHLNAAGPDDIIAQCFHTNALWKRVADVVITLYGNNNKWPFVVSQICNCSWPSDRFVTCGYSWRAVAQQYCCWIFALFDFLCFAKRMLVALRVYSFSSSCLLQCVQFCQTLENYGYIRCKPCLADFPEKDTRVVVCLGNYEVKFRWVAVRSLPLLKTVLAQNVFFIARLGLHVLTKLYN